MIANIMGI